VGRLDAQEVSVVERYVGKENGAPRRQKAQKDLDLDSLAVFNF
jgi:hypothetical protein